MLYYKSNNIELYNDDCITIELDKKVDLIVTSPPYNVGIDYSSNNDSLDYDFYINEFTLNWLSNCYSNSNDNARLCVNIPFSTNKYGTQPVSADIIKQAQKAGWIYKITIIWNKQNVCSRTAWGSYMSASAPMVIPPCESIEVFYKKGWKKVNGSKKSDITDREFIDYTNGLWVIKPETINKYKHPAPFPEMIPYRCIKLFSYLEDIVYDPFNGSGTTILVAKKTGRYGIGVELDKDYCEMSKQRIINDFGFFI